MDKYVMRDGELFRDDGDGSGIVLYGTGAILRELNALQNRLDVISEHSAALAMSNYDLIAENNALQQRVEELESRLKQALHFEDDTADGYDWQVLESAFKYDDLRASVSEAVKEIEEEDIYGQLTWNAIRPILRKHGLVECK